MKRTDYFIVSVRELPVKVIYDGNQVQVLTYEFETGDFIPNVTNWATLYFSHDAIEQVSKEAFEDYVTTLRELCHLEAPRYYIIDKQPIKVLPVNDRYPVDPQGFIILISFLRVCKRITSRNVTLSKAKGLGVNGRDSSLRSE
ncbi:MAG: hypothetical protein JXR84_23290 [Anaerolineae bacterium]|nr:hypothetical protein [Anaerolineae bacterium]